MQLYGCSYLLKEGARLNLSRSSVRFMILLRSSIHLQAFLRDSVNSSLVLGFTSPPATDGSYHLTNYLLCAQNFTTTLMMAVEEIWCHQIFQENATKLTGVKNYASHIMLPAKYKNNLLNYDTGMAAIKCKIS